MSTYVAILEDDVGRVGVMRECLGSLLPQHKCAVFDNAAEMIAWLRSHIGDVVLVSLDHDLPLHQMRDGQRVDAGTGRMVADHLAALAPTCPVIVHTSNENFGPGMMRVLEDAGWTHCRVYPHEDCQWIRTSWADAIRRYIEGRSIVTAGA